MSLEAEHAVLGGIMLKPETYWLIADLLTDEDFSNVLNRRTFKAIRELTTDSAPIDAITVSQHDKGLALENLIDLVAQTPSASNVRAYAEIVAKSSEKTRLRHAGTRIATSNTFSEAQQILADVRPQTAVKLSTAKEAAHAMYNEIVARYDAKNVLTGFSTSITGLDEMTMGLQAGQLCIVAARPSMGKSAYASQLALGGRAFIASLEMTKQQLMERAVANLGNFPYRWIRNPKDEGSEEVWARLTAFMPKAIALDWVIDDSSGSTMDTICARIRQAHMQKPLQVAVIDHLGLIARAGRNDASEIGLITTQAKGLAKDLNIPVVLLCQLNRKVEERNDKRPQMSDLRDSGRIEEDADTIIFLYRPEYYNLSPMGYVEFIVAKNRDGETGSAWAISRLSNMRLESCQQPEYQEPVKAVRGFGR